MDFQPHGKGKFTWNNGKMYIGQWQSNKRKKGLMVLPNGEYYNGEWKDGEPHGDGERATQSDGKNAFRKYVGEFANGILKEESNVYKIVDVADNKKQIEKYIKEITGAE